MTEVAVGSVKPVAVSTTATATARDGVELLVRRWVPTGAPWARLLLVHGIAEHSGRYERTGSLLAAADIDAWSFDLRGFGRSGGPRAAVDRWDDYLDDVQDRLAALGRDVPVVLMGHSMGGLVALTYALSDRPAPDLLVLSSPALASTVPAAMRAAAPYLARLAPQLRLSNGLKPDQLATDPAVGEAYFADPLVVTRTTTRLAAEIFGAMDRANQALHRLDIPTLVTHGSDDTIVPTASSEPLAAVAGVERRLYPGLRHETLNEPEGPQMVAAIIAWIRDHLPAS